MIISVDCETKGLDCTKYITGCLIKEGKNKPEIYRDKNKLWQRIIELGKKEQKRGKTLSVYSHNATYDFYAYANLTDKNIKYFSHKPFIVAYMQEGKEIIKFLDTWAIYRMPLKKLGQILNTPKKETPQKLIEGKELTEQELQQAEQYMIQDTKIVQKSITELKKKLREEGIQVKRLYTINQIAINYLINEWRKIENNDYLFWNKKKGELRRVLRAEEIHGAYRGGRVQAFKKGTIKNVTYIDMNSLYPYSATQIEFPDLRTERKKWKPTEQEFEKELINKIGISRVMIKNETNNLGLIPVRTKEGNYYPKKGKTIIGTYTHIELKKAQTEGYKIKEIEWSVTYEKAKENPFKNFMERLYQLRTKENNEFNKYFYKSMMNCSLGKLAQTRTGQEITIDSVEKAKEYIKNQYEIIKGIQYNYMYQKKKVEEKRKPYYAPILPTLVNAKARIIMYEHMKKIPQNDLIYTDTDSIMYTGQHTHKYKISNKMGEFKIEHKNENIKIYGKKTYTIGQEIKISGIAKRDVTQKQFLEGEITTKKMRTLKTTTEIEKVGSFKEEKRNLKEQQENNEIIEKLLDEQEIYIDDDIENINYFITSDTNELK